jgi:hypothetical protein
MKYIILLAFLLINPVTQAEEVEQKSFFDGTKTIHLKFTDVIDDKYNVNVLWMPDDGLAPKLVGPAVIHFVKNRGYSFSVSAEAFHVPSDILNQLGLLKFDYSGDYHTLPVDLNKVYPIEYDSEELSLFDNLYHHGKPRVGSAPFFFEDIDFNGKDELILINTRAGQRWVDSYTIYQSTYKGGNIYNLATDEPFNILDEKSIFDKENRTIDVFSSGGACANSNEKFKLVDGRYTPVEFTEWDSIANGERYVCVESIYTVINNERILKSKSESYWDSEKSENIELGTKYY